MSFKTGHWDIGDVGKVKSMARMAGHFNAGRNSTATVSLYVDGSGTASVAEALTAAAEQVFKPKLSFRQLAIGVVYTAITGSVKYGGASCVLTAARDQV